MAFKSVCESLREKKINNCCNLKTYGFVWALFGIDSLLSRDM